MNEENLELEEKEEVDSLAIVEDKRKRSKGKSKWTECIMEINEDSRFMDNIAIYNKYLNTAKAKSPSTFKTTYINYLSNMMIFFEWASVEYPNFYLLDKEESLKNIVSILEDYISFLHEERSNNSRSINTKIAAVSSFYIWAVKRNLVDGHPFKNKLDKLKVGADDVRESYFLTDDQIEIINRELEHRIEITDKKLQELRVYTIWKVMLDTAGRRRSILHIKVKDVNFMRGLIENVIEKGGKRVEFIISTETVELIKEYLRTADLKPDDYLFPSIHDSKKPMSYGALAYWIRDIGNIVGIPDYYPHSIRKTRINQICDKFGLEIASSYANHQTTKVTKDHYVKTKSASDLRNLILSTRKE